MSVGLYDMDMKTYKQVPINLEMAKLSSYYKRKREIVAMSSSFQPSRYSKFILRKDYEDGIYPKNIMKFDNIDGNGRLWAVNMRFLMVYMYHFQKILKFKNPI